MIKSKREPSFRCEKVEALVRPIFPESDDRWMVLVRDGMTQVVTYVGSNKDAVEHAERLFSIIRAMKDRLQKP